MSNARHERVFILGAGRAGRGLARALRASGAALVGLHGRCEEQGEIAVTAGRIPYAARDASVVLVTVRDAQVDAALTELAAAELAPGAVVLHASGSVDPPGLADFRARGHPAGTFHPLVPLADPARAPAVLRGAWIGVDGDPAAVTAARGLAARMGAHTLAIPAGQKPVYHAAAVFASNFPMVLAAVAVRLFRDAGIPENEAWPAIERLVAGAVENMRGSAPEQALTGPVVRGDVDTVRLHLAALGNDGDALTAYKSLTRAALPLARRVGTDPRPLAEIESLVERDGE